MKYLLLPTPLAAVALISRSRVLLAFDFDGTLAPIVADRGSAAMRASTRALLARVSRLYPTAVISGRGREDVAARLLGARVKFVVGSHGQEPRARVPHPGATLREARTRLEQLVQATPGLDLEDKRFSLAVHYRRARSKAAAERAIRAAVEGVQARLRVVPGQYVLDVLPDAAPHKGDALLALRSKARAEAALYVGDDVTDEDVFRLDQPGRLLTVRVGRSPRSAARYFLRDQREVDGLLERLITLRERTPR